MALYPKGEGIAFIATAGNFPALKSGPGTLLSISFVGGTGATIAAYDSLTVSGTPVAVWRSENATDAFNHFPMIAFKDGLSLILVGTFLSGSYVSITVE